MLCPSGTWQVGMSFGLECRLLVDAWYGGMPGSRSGWTSQMSERPVRGRERFE